VAVISILKRSGASTRLTVIIEGETLFNDGVAVVIYSAMTAAVVTGVFSPLIVVTGVILSIVMGAIVGGVVGYVVYKLMMIVDDNFIRILLSLIAAYGSYQLATGLNGSGYTSVAVAGVIVGSYVQIPQREVEHLDMIWQFIAFIVSSISFVLIGIYVLPSLLGQYLVAILTSILIVLGARAITVYGLSPSMKSNENNIPRKWQHIVVWAGLRGPVSVMLALGLGSLPLAQADKLTAITFGIVLFSILFQGLSMRFLIEKLRIQE
jgi:CPA1 family monovalent cation:H+ antiporter